MKHLRKALAAAAATIALGLGGWLALRPPPEHALRIGINIWPGYEHLYLAQQKGMFKTAGVDVEIVEFNSLWDARRAFERGQIDGLGTTNFDVLISRSLSGKSLQTIQVIDFSEGGDQIVADSGIHSVADLKGKKIGLEAGSVSVYVLGRALEMSGLSTKDVGIVSTDQNTLIAWLDRGTIAALVTYQPYTLTALKRPGRHRIFSSMQIPGEVMDVLAFDADFARTHAPAIKKFLDGYWMARNFADSHPEQAIPTMALHERMSDSEFTATLRDEIRLADKKSQALVLRDGGSMRQILRTGEAILRATGQISNDPRSDRSWSDQFLPEEPSEK